MSSGKTAWTTAIVAFLAITSSAVWASDAHRHASPYGGQERRSVKSLADEEVADLLAGRGAGLAKAAELNGVPGPVHLLEMKAEIALSGEQESRIRAVHRVMQEDARALGERLVALETELNGAFASRTANRPYLRDLLQRIADVQRDLRFVHLAAHLDMPDILNAEQIRSYNRLRGYAAAADPCAAPPAGHDADLWRRHNNCPR